MKRVPIKLGHFDDGLTHYFLKRKLRIYLEEVYIHPKDLDTLIKAEHLFGSLCFYSLHSQLDSLIESVGDLIISLIQSGDAHIELNPNIETAITINLETEINTIKSLKINRRLCKLN